MPKYYATADIKTGDGVVAERGEEITQSKVGGKDAFDELKANGGVVDGDTYDAMFPEDSADEPEIVNQPPGTPSNLEQIEGTELEAPGTDFPDAPDGDNASDAGGGTE